MIYDKNVEKLILKYENDVINALKECFNNIEVITTIYNDDVIGTVIFSDKDLIYDEIYNGYDLTRSTCDVINECGFYDDVVKEYVKFYEKLKEYRNSNLQTNKNIV